MDDKDIRFIFLFFFINFLGFCNYGFLIIILVFLNEMYLFEFWWFFNLIL